MQQLWHVAMMDDGCEKEREARVLLNNRTLGVLK